MLQESSKNNPTNSREERESLSESASSEEQDELPEKQGAIHRQPDSHQATGEQNGSVEFPIGGEDRSKLQTKIVSKLDQPVPKPSRKSLLELQAQKIVKKTGMRWENLSAGSQPNGGGIVQGGSRFSQKRHSEKRPSRSNDIERVNIIAPQMEVIVPNEEGITQRKKRRNSLGTTPHRNTIATCEEHKEYKKTKRKNKETNKVQFKEQEKDNTKVEEKGDLKQIDEREKK